MDSERLNHLLSVINQLTQSQEKLLERLRKVEAMAHIATLTENFLTFEPSIVHNYLWQLSDLLDDASQQGEEILNTLFKISC